MWTLVDSTNAARVGHTATLLPNGRVLVAGGGNASGALASAEVYDPAIGQWTPTVSMNTARTLHTATLLANGRVLVVGGWSSGTCCLASAELYDAATGTWASTGSLNSARFGHTATLLPNGQVLVVGGCGYSECRPSLKDAEVYDPSTGSWGRTDAMNDGRSGHTATLLNDGRVLATGGRHVYPLDSAELYSNWPGWVHLPAILQTSSQR
jgi:N-acetylneuraminic acid mutarotase